MKISLFQNGCRGVLSIVVSAALFLIAGCQQAEISTAAYPASATPRLVELGTAICIPCAMTKPGLDELKQEYAGRLEVEVIDTVLVNPSAKTQYNAPFCATQIYIAASGKELFRHVGYASKDEILAKWKELGVDLAAPAPQSEPKPTIAPVAK